MIEEKVGPLGDLLTHSLDQNLEKWGHQESIRLYDELKEALMISACQWIGIDLLEEDLADRTHDLSILMETGSGALNQVRINLAKWRLSKWIKKRDLKLLLQVMTLARDISVLVQNLWQHQEWRERLQTEGMLFLDRLIPQIYNPRKRREIDLIKRVLHFMGFKMKFSILDVGQVAPEELILQHPRRSTLDHLQDEFQIYEV